MPASEDAAAEDHARVLQQQEWNLSRSWRPGVQTLHPQGHPPSGGCGGALPTSSSSRGGIPWLVAPSLPSPFRLYPASSLRVGVPLSKVPASYKDTSHTRVRPTLTQHDLVWTGLHLPRPYFQVRLGSRSRWTSITRGLPVPPTTNPVQGQTCGSRATRSSSGTVFRKLRSGLCAPLEEALPGTYRAPPPCPPHRAGEGCGVLRPLPISRAPCMAHA